jgi:hypothetical protein
MEMETAGLTFMVSIQEKFAPDTRIVFWKVEPEFYPALLLALTGNHREWTEVRCCHQNR